MIARTPRLGAIRFYDGPTDLLAKGAAMTWTRRTLAAATCALLAAGALTAAAPSAKADARLEGLWADLASENEADAGRALLALAARPKDAVALIAARLAPVKVDAARFAKLLEQLDEGDFDRRLAARREIEYLGKFARPLLDKALEGEPSPEVRKAVGDLLRRLPPEGKQEVPKLRGNSVSIANRNGDLQIVIDGKVLDLAALAKQAVYPTNAQWLRAARAVALLESVGTPEAKAALRALAAGQAGARPTDEAKAALGRLEK